jgi:dimethylaniline monooxygenase (N-oxide forming)
MEDYHVRYAQHFDLYPYIKFETEVLSVDLVDPNADVDALEYIVTYRTGADGKEETQTFDKVVVATGLQVVPKVPKVEGIEAFKGEVWNSQSYKGSVVRPPLASRQDLCAIY